MVDQRRSITLDDMKAVRVETRVSPAQASDYEAFAERYGGLSDHLRLDLEHQSGDGFLAITVIDHTDGLIAYAQVSGANDGAVVETFGDDEPVLDLLKTAVDLTEGPLTWWTARPTASTIAADAGFVLDRTLLRMGRDLPTDRASHLTTRAFRPGLDEEAWLRVNNRAFADHGEQGGWMPETLASRQAEAWFDPDGFRLYEDDEGLAGFCWTKIHDDPPSGEIYVIAVDPRAHGRGLGTQLVLAGLDHLTAHGLSTAHLYVDAANSAAVSLYRRLGFVTLDSRQAFTATVSGRARPSDDGQRRCPPT